MLRKLPLFGLAAVATLAMSGVVASAAMAEEAFTSSVAPASASGGQTTPHSLTMHLGAVTCNEAEFVSMTAVPAVGAVTIHPEYDDCDFSETAIPITVNTSNDNYLFTTPAGKKGNVDVVGTGGIVLSGFGCTITFPNQELGHVIYKNEPTGDVLVTATVTGLDYTHSGFLCPSHGITDTDGTYTGSTLVSSPTANGSVD